MQVIKASEVFEKLEEKKNNEQVTAFIEEFNQRMADPKYVENWRCGGNGPDWWAFGVTGRHHSQSTEMEIRNILAAGGWGIKEVIRGEEDRGLYTTYRIGLLKDFPWGETLGVQGKD